MSEYPERTREQMAQGRLEAITLLGNGVNVCDELLRRVPPAHLGLGLEHLVRLLRDLQVLDRHETGTAEDWGRTDELLQRVCVRFGLPRSYPTVDNLDGSYASRIHVYLRGLCAPLEAHCLPDPNEAGDDLREGLSDVPLLGIQLEHVKHVRNELQALLQMRIPRNVPRREVGAA